MNVVEEWEAAVKVAEEHWERGYDLDGPKSDDPPLCEGDRCVECQYDSCVYEACEKYRELQKRVGETHRAVVEAARSSAVRSDHGR